MITLAVCKQLLSSPSGLRRSPWHVFGSGNGELFQKSKNLPYNSQLTVPKHRLSERIFNGGKKVKQNHAGVKQTNLNVENNGPRTERTRGYIYKGQN